MFASRHPANVLGVLILKTQKGEGNQSGYIHLFSYGGHIDTKT